MLNYLCVYVFFFQDWEFITRFCFLSKKGTLRFTFEYPIVSITFRLKTIGHGGLLQVYYLRFQKEKLKNLSPLVPSRDLILSESGSGELLAVGAGLHAAPVV